MTNPSLLLGVLLACTGISAALVSSAPTTSSSQPFALVLSSANQTLDSSLLYAAHSGAGIENLNVGSKNRTLTTSNTFVFNTTDDGYTDPTLGKSGLVAWTLYGSGFNVSQPLAFSYSPTSDTAILKFGLSQGSQFYFKNDTLVIGQFGSNGTTTPLSRFFICALDANQNGGYSYTSLVWKLGKGKPDNKDCQKVTVKRVFL
ncbi:hypothetical protein BCR37DRAFT_155665 [Protomyces lactucae-debilis]|uniref:DUF7907 domain-containing protein n=1 Tax=Protomyces lactucae-debilis TaxID=2754530 RepID=A0A1Y2F1Q8_PROLT|nr:uncharacterized protein BCR37DRAFT_155665 [Protomyces lactucae-debilis]ORY77424.1 hypothetical protein BCR37DRAFT_155665 [Protomyces lactucae-debilis]